MKMMYHPFRAKNIIKSLSQGCRPRLYSVSPSGFTSTYRNFNLVVTIHELPLHTVTKAFAMLVQPCSLNRNILVQSRTIEPAKQHRALTDTAALRIFKILD